MRFKFICITRFTFSSKQYLCDDHETCFPHAKQLCLSRYCSMADVDSSTVDKSYGFPTSQITNDIDALHVSDLQPLEVTLADHIM